jgi:xanthosine utilization system XapX-like protein
VPQDDLVHTASLTAPRWVIALAAGLPAGILVGLFVAFATPAPWPAAIACGVLVGALIGSAYDLRARKQRELVRAAAGDLPTDVLVAALRATRDGAVPTDPQIREAALKIASHQLTLTPSKTVALSVFPLTGGVLAILNASSAPDWVLLVFALPALLALVCTGVLIWQAYYLPRRLRERIRLLSVPTA